MYRYVAILPLLSALAVAQDRQIIVDRPDFRAEYFGLDVAGSSSAMTTELMLVSNEVGDFIYVVVPDPTPVCHLTLFVGSGETRLPLDLIGIEGWLLVDPIFAHVTVPLRDPIWLPRNEKLAGLDVFFQSALVRMDPITFQPMFSLSQGLRLTYMDCYPGC